MIVVENPKLEQSVLKGISCIAVPVEVFVPQKGEAIVTTYSFCVDVAGRWEEKHKDELLSDAAVECLKADFETIAENIGYRYFLSENEYMLEYKFTPDMRLTKSTDEIKVHKISSNAVLSKLCAASGCDIEIADDGEDILFAVVEDGMLCAYAGMNDVIYDDGSVEISVETAPEHRRQGYGLACVEALVTHLVNKGITVRYKCSKLNAPSSALAEKCGFVLDGKRFSFVCEKI